MKNEAVKKTVEEEGKVFRITKGQIEELHEVRIEIEGVLSRIDTLSTMGKETATAQEDGLYEVLIYWPDAFKMIDELAIKAINLAGELYQQVAFIEHPEIKNEIDAKARQEAGIRERRRS